MNEPSFGDRLQSASKCRKMAVACDEYDNKSFKIEIKQTCVTKR